MKANKSSESLNVFLMSYTDDKEHIELVSSRMSKLLDKLSEKYSGFEVYSLQLSGNQIFLNSWHYDKQQPEAVLREMTAMTCMGLEQDRLHALPIHVKSQLVDASDELPRTDYIYVIAKRSTKPYDISDARIVYVFELLDDICFIFKLRDTMKSARNTSIPEAIKSHNMLHETGKIKLHWCMYLCCMDKKESQLLSKLELEYIQKKQRLLQEAISITREYRYACRNLELLTKEMRQTAGDDVVDAFEHARMRYLNLSPIASYHFGKISREIYSDQPLEWEQLFWYDARRNTRMEETALENAYRLDKNDAVSEHNLQDYKILFDKVHGCNHLYVSVKLIGTWQTSRIAC